MTKHLISIISNVNDDDDYEILIGHFVLRKSYNDAAINES